MALLHKSSFGWKNQVKTLVEINKLHKTNDIFFTHAPDHIWHVKISILLLRQQKLLHVHQPLIVLMALKSS